MIRGGLIVTLALLLAFPARADEARPPGRAKRIAGVVTVLTGAALLVAAGALVNQASQDNDTTNNLFLGGGVWNQQARDVDAEGRRDNVAAAVLFPLGAAALVAGVAVAIVGWRQDKKWHPPLVPQNANGNGMASWAVSF